MTEELREALLRLKGHRMTKAELDAQRLSFVYGNAPSWDRSTKEQVRCAIELGEFTA